MFWTVTEKLLGGFSLSCIIFGVTLVAALPLGLILCLGSMSKWAPFRQLGLRAKGAFAQKLFALRPVGALVSLLIWIILGTPLMLQIIAVFYGPGLLFGWSWPFVRSTSTLVAVLIAFVVNYACYFSEIYRGGIEGIPTGQQEAGLVLGMKRSQIFLRVTLLQVIKRIVPPMGNEIITLIKDTALANIIAVSEIVMVAQTYIAVNALIWPLFYSGVFYLLFCGLLTLLFRALERKLSYFRV